MNNLKIDWNTDAQGNRHTSASYIDADGYPRGTRLNGHLMQHEVIASIENHQKRTKEQK